MIKIINMLQKLCHVIMPQNFKRVLNDITDYFNFMPIIFTFFTFYKEKEYLFSFLLILLLLLLYMYDSYC